GLRGGSRVLRTLTGWNTWSYSGIRQPKRADPRPREDEVMRKSLAAAVVAMVALVAADRALAQEHLVTTTAAQARLAAAEDARQHDLARRVGALFTPEAA